MSTDRRTRAWVEVQAGAVRRNLRRIRDSVGPGPALIPMVKADAYGLGVARAITAMEPVEPWGFGVATVAEGRELRELGVQRPVLVFTPLPQGSYAAVVDWELTPCISDLDGLRALREAARRAMKPVPFHLEVDTGMGRAGLDWRQAGEWTPRLAELAGPPLRFEGCFTHFHSADEAEPASLQVQWKRLGDVLSALPAPESGLMVHACNSPAALRCPELAMDGVRPGIFLYGGVAGADLPDPEPVVAVRARAVLVKEVPPGSTVGYGATHVARRWERWATLGIGYGDGLPRALGNRGHAIVRGRRVPIVGRISMDLTVVDITDVSAVEPGEAATLIGRDGEAEVSLEEVAELAGTINYEILTGLTPRLPRVWIDDGGD